MNIDVNNIFDKFSAIFEKAKLHAALFSDVIAAIEESHYCRIHLREVSDANLKLEPGLSMCASQQIEVILPDTANPIATTEHFVFVSAITRDNFDLVRFGVAHELGHIFLHHSEEMKNKNKVDYAPFVDKSINPYIIKYDRKQELEADMFAFLLMASKGKIQSRERIDIDHLIRIYKRLNKEVADEINYEMISHILELLSKQSSNKGIEHNR